MGAHSDMVTNTNITLLTQDFDQICTALAFAQKVKKRNLWHLLLWHIMKCNNKVKKRNAFVRPRLHWHRLLE